jgi:hypothetical protein
MLEEILIKLILLIAYAGFMSLMFVLVINQDK